MNPSRTVAHHVDAESFKEFMSTWPTGVAVVTTLGVRDEPLGFTCSSLCGLSLKPPLLLVCVSNGSATLGALLEQGVFAVNLLGKRGQEVAEVFSSPISDRFDRVEWKPTPQWSLPALLGYSHAVTECALHSTYTVGDHTIVVGAVAGVWLAGNEFTPLLHGLRRYRAWPD